MENMRDVYKQLTNVDIEEQKQIWDERGKGYYGEYLLFCRLYRVVKGDFKILMNLNLPTEDGKKTEIDLLMIHETGLYVFEVKHHKGTIYGTDEDEIWTQYFKTTSNKTFQNPIEQNGYHIRALKTMFSDIDISSVVVFTNDDCEVRVKNGNSYIDVCKLNNVETVLKRRLNCGKKILSMQQIEDLFQELSQYAPIQNPILVDGVSAPFESWVQPITYQLKQIEEDSVQLKKSIERKTEKLRKQRIFNSIAMVCVIVLCIVVSVLSVIGNKKYFDAKLIEAENSYDSDLAEAQQSFDTKIAEFEQKFLHIDEIDNPYIDALGSYIDVADVSLLPMTDDAVRFSAKLTWKADAYAFQICEDAKYIVMLTDGKIHEYDMFDENFKYYKSDNRLSTGYRPSGKLKEVYFYGINDISTIEYIKITGISIGKVDTINSVIKDELELELYKK